MPALVLNAGQSNALGYNLTASDLPESLSGWSDPHAQIWNPATSSFQTMVAGVNTSSLHQTGVWGPQVQFAYDWVHAHPGDTLYIVDSFLGSTGLAQDGSQTDWSPASSGELFDATTHVLAAARSVVNLPLSTILWTQGEQDAIDPAKAAAYQANLESFVAHARAAWGDAGTSFEIGRISANQTSLGAGAETVRHGQDAVGAIGGDAIVVNTDTFPVSAVDHLHYTGVGQYDLGRAYFEAYEFSSRVVNGQASSETLPGASGNDLVFGNDGDDVLFGNAGDDVLQGNAGSDVLQGNAGRDVLHGGKGADVLLGGMGDDVILGDAGDDYVSGDKGNDTETGGAGADRFAAGAGTGSDVIVDFNVADGDTVSLSAGTTYTISYVGGDTIMVVGGDGRLDLAGVHLSGTNWVVFG